MPKVFDEPTITEQGNVNDQTPAPGPAASAKPAPPAAPVDDPYDFGNTTHDESISVAPASGSSESQKPATPIAPPAVPAGPAAQSHPAWLLRQAANFGISAEEAAAMTTAQLDRTLSVVERQQAAFNQHLAQQQAKAATPDPDAVDEELGIPKSALVDFDPQLLAMVRHVNKRGTEEVKALKAEVTAYKEREAERLRHQVWEKIDKKFDRLDELVPGTFGKGDRSKVTKEMMANRKKLLAAEQGLKETFSKLGSEVADAELEAMAVRAVFGSTTPSAAPIQPTAPAASSRAPADSLEERRKQWMEQGLARPTARVSSEEPGEKKAIATAGRIMKERGLLDEGHDYDNGQFLT